MPFFSFLEMDMTPLNFIENVRGKDPYGPFCSKSYPISYL